MAVQSKSQSVRTGTRARDNRIGSAFPIRPTLRIRIWTRDRGRRRLSSAHDDARRRRRRRPLRALEFNVDAAWTPSERTEPQWSAKGALRAPPERAEHAVNASRPQAGHGLDNSPARRRTPASRRRSCSCLEGQNGASPCNHQVGPRSLLSRPARRSLVLAWVPLCEASRSDACRYRTWGVRNAQRSSSRVSRISSCLSIPLHAARQSEPTRQSRRRRRIQPPFLSPVVRRLALGFDSLSRSRMLMHAL